MSRFLDAQAAAKAHIYSLYMVIVFLMIGCIGLWFGWKESPQYIRISIPPDLRSGAVVRPGEYQAAQVFAFARMHHLALNRWEVDGTVDFPKRIEELQAYMTPEYRDNLILTMQNKMERGELKGRTRYTLPLEGFNEYLDTHVRTLNDGSWEVDLQVEIVEKVAGLEAKRVRIYYPLSVVRINIDPVKNIWGLALNGVAEGKQEQRLENN